MTVLERLKIELNNKEYLSDPEYITLLKENDLTETVAYVKSTMQKSLLYTVIDVLEIISNDIDKLRKVETDFATTESAFKHLEKRIEKIKQRIYEISDEETDSNISLLYSRK